MQQSRSVKQRLADLLPPSLRFWLKHRLALSARRRQRGESTIRQVNGWQRATNDGAHKPGLNVMVFDDHTPAPDRDAGGARMLYILKTLRKLGQPVFISLSDLRQPEYERHLHQEGIETAHWTNYKELLKERSFQIALFSRPDVAAALLRSTKRTSPNTKTIFDTVDIVFRRLEREFQLSGERETATRARRYRKLESQLARSCDQVWCVTEDDQEVLQQEARANQFEIVPTIHPLQPRGRPFVERNGLMFIGNYLHRPNEDAVHYFMKEIQPLLQEMIPNVKTTIVGGNASPAMGAYASTNVSIAGYLPDVDEIFHSSRVFIAPLRYGSGIKGKIGQALSYGLPVVTTSIGAEGMKLENGKEALIADDPRTFAEAVARVYQDQQLWQELSDNGYAHVANHYTPEIVERQIHDAIFKLCGRT